MAATTKRTSGRLAPRKSRNGGPSQDDRDDGHERRADRDRDEDQRETLGDRQPAPEPAGRRRGAERREAQLRPHLSIPPMTGSSEETMAIVSASRLPGSSAGTVSRFRKLGSWMRKRNG